MAQITGMADLSTLAATRRQTFDVMKGSGATTFAAGNFYSGWLFDGSVDGAVPGATSVPTKATAGAFANFNNAGGGEFLNILGFEATIMAAACPVFLWDRLVHMGGLDSTVITLNTINTSAITRGDTTGHGVMGFIESYVTMGSTPQILTVSYTNQAGTPGQITTVSIPATMRLGRIIPIPLLTGDTGIRSVETVQLPGSTGTAGNYGVTLARKLLSVFPKDETVTAAVHGLEGELVKVDNDACLWMTFLSSGSGSPGAVIATLDLYTTG